MAAFCFSMVAITCSNESFWIVSTGEETARKYFTLLNSSPVDIIQKDSLEQVMASIEKQKAAMTFSHFEDLKKICTAEQVKNFDALVPQLIKILIAPHPKNGPPPPRRD